MSQFQTTDFICALFPTRIGDGKQFLVISQDSAGKMKIYKKVGGRFRLALFEDDGAGGTFYDVSNITSVQFLITQAESNFVLEVQEGPFANITSEQWRSGIKPTAQHFLFQFSSNDLNLAPGTYTLSITGNTSDPLAPVDFYVECELEVLDREDATGNAEALDDDDILEAINQQVQATLATKANLVGKPGDRLALTSAALHPITGLRGRIWLEAVVTPDGDLILDQQKEFIAP